MPLRAFLAALLCTLGGAPAPAPASSPAKASSPITEKNWRTHPRIVEIRSLVKANEAAIRSGKWRGEVRDCESRDPSRRMDAIAFRDRRGRIRKYTTADGTDDSAYRIEHQYDGRGRLRFVLAKSGAFNFSVLTYRIYFDVHGEEIWRDEESTGPGYTFLRPPDFPDASLIRDPVKDLARPLRCDSDSARNPT